MRKLNTKPAARDIAGKIARNMTVISCLVAAAVSSGCTTKTRAFNIELDQQKLTVKQGSTEILSYQAQPIAVPIGGDKFKGSNFIHPLNTPLGFTVTQLQPADHLHHFGLWWPWKFIKIGDRKILCWELQKGDGLIKGREILDKKVTRTGAEFTAASDYIDRKAPGGPRVVLHEKLKAKIAKPVDSPAHGYFLDLTIIQQCAIDSPIEIVKYRYSGFGFRGAASWNKDSSTLLTSEGKDRDTSNNTRGKWVRVQGDTPAGGKAGILLMSHPGNYDAPQRLRTWNSKMHDGSVFVNFNPVQEKSWTFQPGKDYTQRYQMFVYDGTVTAEQCEELWLKYARTSRKK
jgi:hypothetical protein